jgi:hypothetical protein
MITDIKSEDRLVQRTFAHHNAFLAVGNGDRARYGFITSK